MMAIKLIVRQLPGIWQFAFTTMLPDMCVKQTVGLMEVNMKKIVLCLMLTLIPSLALAGTWCQWSGTEEENCQSTSRTFITINNVKVTVSAENLNPRGWYELTVTQPTLGENQVKDAVVRDFADNEISKTWTVRDMTVEEIDIRDAEAMSVSDYYQWQAIIQFTSVTQAQIVTYLQTNAPELIEAYQARDRLESP